jgi:hypothetical protein
MGWLFGAKQNGNLVKQGEAALQKFELQKQRAEKEKTAFLNRQVEIWSVTTTESNSGLENEYRHAAALVALNVQRMERLEEHLKAIRLGLFHAKNGEFKKLEEILTVVDPCADLKEEILKVDFKHTAPSS